MFIPFLGKIYNGSAELEKRIFICIWLLSSAVVPVAIDLLGMSRSPVAVYGFEPFTGFMGLFFLGAYLYEKRKERGFSWAALNILGFIATGIAIATSTFFLSVHRGAPVEIFYGYRTPFVVASAVFLFNFAICLPKIEGILARLIRIFSDCSLGIYCIHPLVIYLATKWWGGELVIGWVSVALMAFSVFVISALIVRISRLIPLIRHVA